MNRRKIGIRSILILAVFFSFIFTGGCNGSNPAEPGKLPDRALLTGNEENLSDEKQHDTYKQDTDDLREIIREAVSNKSSKVIEFNGDKYKITEADGGDLSGERQALAAVDIGYGDREYWAFTNKYGQLVYVYAEKIIPQDEDTEPVTKDGRYYNDEAKVAGTEREDYDEGHVIADSLGGVSNAYNITPQNSTLNRHGNQAYMEKFIRDAGGCQNFIAVITYPDTSGQIPSHYHYEYILDSENITDDFDNVNPDEVNKKLIDKEKGSAKTKDDKPHVKNKKNEIDDGFDLSKVDLNGDGKVTIAEAKAAGYKMPIYSDHWLYPYMDDRDGDGIVGE